MPQWATYFVASPLVPLRRTGTFYRLMKQPIRLQRWRLLQAAALAGLVVVGCAERDSHERTARRSPGALTFNKDIAPIIYERCSACHRPEAAAPFSLLSYADVRERAALIRASVEGRRMPPWLPEPGFAEFAGERRLSEGEISTIVQWVEEGALQGDPEDLPPPPELAAGWQLGQPDLVLEMPEPFALYGSGPEIFRNFVIPIPLDEARWVRAVEFHPGNPRAVHHSVMMIDRTRSSRRVDAADPLPGYEGMFSTSEASAPDGFFLGWTPGKVPSEAGSGLAWRLEPGSDLVLQLHLRPTGQPEQVRSVVGVYFADRSPERQPLLLRLGSQTIDIAPGASDYTIEDSYQLPIDVEVLGIYPHAHYLGKQMTASATLPDGSVRWLLRIDDWDLMWQGEYRYAEPVSLPKGSKLSMQFSYDNSADNPRNPNDPPARVVYGPDSDDEMGDLWIQVLPRDRADLAVLTADFTRKELTALADGFRQMVRLRPEDVQAHYNLGLALQSLGAVAEAAGHYREALRIKPNYAAAHNNLGSILVAAGKPDEAINHLNKAIELEPDFAQAEYNIGNALQTRGRLAAAIERYHRALEIDPHYLEARYNLANVYLAQGAIEPAIEEYRLAVATDSAFVPARYNLGNALQGQGKLDEAIEQYRLAIELDPTFAPAHSNLGTALEALGKIEEAISHYRRAVEADPSLAIAHQNLAATLRSQGRYPEAVPHLEAALSVRPSDPELRHSLGRALIISGRAGDGLVHIRNAAELRPDWIPPLQVLAWTLATHPDDAIRDPEEAVRLGTRAAELSRFRNPLVLDALAAALAASGRYDAAAGIAQRAMNQASTARAAALADSIRGRLDLYRRGRAYVAPISSSQPG